MKENKKNNLNDLNRKKFKMLVSIILLITGIFLSLILKNEYTLNSGDELFLKTVPIDPRDILRGDFVILRYSIQIDDRISKLINTENLTYGDRIYLILEKDDDDFGILKDVSLNEPESQLYIKAKVISDNTTLLIDNRIQLDIDKYFVPEGRGREIENLRGNLSVLVSIDKFGDVLIKDLYSSGKKIEFLNKENELNINKPR